MFTDEAYDMGLTQLDDGLYEYKDRYSSVWYEILCGVSRNNRLPSLGIFTSGPNENIDDAKYVGIVSTEYKFVGNAKILDAMMESINNIGDIELREHCIFNHQYTQILSELLLFNNSQHSTEIGTVVPMITVENSYNGSKAETYSFGVGIVDNGYNLVGSFTFKKKILGMRQIHLFNARSTITSNIGSYVDVFRENISDLIQTNFNTSIPPEDAMKALGLIEKIGKRRYANIVNNLSQLTNQTIETNDENIQLPPINAWNMFLAIVTYSCKEENLNAKKMLENIAERTLLIPTRMLQALR